MATSIMHITTILGASNYIDLPSLFELPIFKHTYEAEKAHCDLEDLEGFLSYWFPDPSNLVRAVIFFGNDTEAILCLSFVIAGSHIFTLYDSHTHSMTPRGPSFTVSKDIKFMIPFLRQRLQKRHLPDGSLTGEFLRNTRPSAFVLKQINRSLHIDVEDLMNSSASYIQSMGQKPWTSLEAVRPFLNDIVDHHALGRSRAHNGRGTHSAQCSDKALSNSSQHRRVQRGHRNKFAPEVDHSQFGWQMSLQNQASTFSSNHAVEHNNSAKIGDLLSDSVNEGNVPRYGKQSEFEWLTSLAQDHANNTDSLGSRQNNSCTAEESTKIEDTWEVQLMKQLQDEEEIAATFPHRTTSEYTWLVSLHKQIQAEERAKSQYGASSFSHLELDWQLAVQMQHGDQEDIPRIIVNYDGDNEVSLHAERSTIRSDLLHVPIPERRESGDQFRLLTFASPPALFPCSICGELLTHADKLGPSECGHGFCKDCLTQFTRTKIQEGRYPIFCPDCLADRAPTKYHIVREILDQLSLSSEEFGKLGELEVVSHAVSIECPRCKETMHVDRVEYSQHDIIICPLPSLAISASAAAARFCLNMEPHLVDKKATFASFSHILDSRLLRALADSGFSRPTLVQAKAIPLALESRDILARARTGSGKTAAYCIPVVQKILSIKSNLTPEDENRQTTRALILVPTRELSEQVSTSLKGLISYCDKDITVCNVAAGTTSHLQRTLLSDKPDILISTPSRALILLQAKTISLSALESLVIDEADLILSYGHDEDVRAIFSGGYLPKVYQSFLMSATMTEDVELLKGLALRNPAILKLEEGEDEAALLSQYSVRCSEVDKFLLIYVILKLKLIRGKCIIFVNDVDRSYRLKLFLEQFSIKTCVLNSELPLNSRYHVVQEFNKGVYDYIIATDESGASGEYDTEDEEEADELDNEEEFTSTQREPVEELSPEPSSSKPETNKRRRESSPPSGRPRKRDRKDKGKAKEYGVTRGVDFVDVACVVNFDLPTSSRSYTHRVGRTARAGRTGMSLSFVVPKDQWGKNKVVGCLPSAEKDEVVFNKIEREQGARGSKIKEYKFDMKQVEAFRYRMEDALRSVTKAAIREARVKELKTEILNSDKLKAHFEDNPLDLEFLRHDKPLHPTRVQPHMKHVPKYLLPRIAPVPGAEAEGDEGKAKSFVPFKKDPMRGKGRGRGRGGRGGGPSGRGGKKKSDPLKKFGK
uniref:RNA helicase n=1 Tax=Psilocybe cubensis TaxID=181762 RepID=A0A8H8CIS5_PSICU